MRSADSTYLNGVMYFKLDNLSEIDEIIDKKYIPKTIPRDIDIAALTFTIIEEIKRPIAEKVR